MINVFQSLGIVMVLLIVKISPMKKIVQKMLPLPLRHHSLVLRNTGNVKMETALGVYGNVTEKMTVLIAVMKKIVVCCYLFYLRTYALYIM